MAVPRLSRERTTALNNSTKALQEHLSTLDKLEECGVDCAAMKNLIAEQIDKNTKIVQYFGYKSALSA